MLFYRLAHLVLGLIFKIFFRLRVVGCKNVPATGPLILACNHVSYLDPPVLGCSFPRPVLFLARRSLFDKPVLGFLFRHLHVRSIIREGHDLTALRTVLRDLKDGNVVVLFPEGTRSLSGELQTAKPGIGFLALKSEVPVVPVYIRGTYEAWPKGQGHIKLTAITTYFGTPIDFQQVLASDESDKNRTASQLIMDSIKRLQEGFN